MRLKAVTGIVALAIIVVSAVNTSALAGRRPYEDGATITAFSRHGNGAIDGVVRRGRYAWEVRLPHGTWISCRRSCEETLRVETVDIFENDGRMIGYGTLQNQCGVFGCLELKLPR